MSLDLLAVQRDAALLDALARRAECPAVDGGADRVAGLLAALVADVDDARMGDRLDDVPGSAVAPLIPGQRGLRGRRNNVSALPVAPVPNGRRHAARTVAALIVAAAVLSVSGVAAAVTGDPLTPYKRVIDVVRSEYDQVVPKALVAPKPTAVPQTAARTLSLVAVARASRQARGVVASRAADGRHAWTRHVGDRAGWDHRGWGRHTSGGHARRGRQPGGSTGRDTVAAGGTSSWQHRSRHRYVGATIGNARDSGWRGVQWGDRRR